MLVMALHSSFMLNSGAGSAEKLDDEIDVVAAGAAAVAAGDAEAPNHGETFAAVGSAVGAHLRDCACAGGGVGGGGGGGGGSSCCC